MSNENLKSSVLEKGKVVTEIIIFSGGNKKTFKGVLTDSIHQSEFVRFDLVDGRRIYVNPKNVDCFEVLADGMDAEEVKASEENE